MYTIQGMIMEEKVDSFNIPIYIAPVQQVEEVVKKNGNFNIETMETITHDKPQPKALSSVYRAAFEGMIKLHFGDDIDIDKLFDMLSKRLEDKLIPAFEPEKAIILFVSLKRN